MVLVEVGELVVDKDGSGNVLRDVERDGACLVLPVLGDHAVFRDGIVSIVLVPG